MKVLPKHRRAAQLNLATEQGCQLAADRQTEPGATKPAIGAGIRLLKGLENDFLLLGRDADTGVRHLEGNYMGTRCSGPDGADYSRWLT